MRLKVRLRDCERRKHASFSLRRALSCATRSGDIFGASSCTCPPPGPCLSARIGVACRRVMPPARFCKFSLSQVRGRSAAAATAATSAAASVSAPALSRTVRYKFPTVLKLMSGQQGQGLTQSRAQAIKTTPTNQVQAFEPRPCSADRRH